MIALEDVAAPIAMLAGAFERAISKAGIKAYQIALSDLTPDELTTATEAALKTCRFMPSPAELRDRRRDILERDHFDPPAIISRRLSTVSSPRLLRPRSR